MKFFIHIALLVFLLPTISYGAEKLKHEEHNEHEKVSGVEALSDDLRTLLSEEMLAIQSGMMSIIPHTALEAGVKLGRLLKE